MGTDEEMKVDRTEALKEIAKELLKKGMAVDQVAKFVDLPIEEIQLLKG